MMVLVIGGLLVAGLVVWALTRTVEPSTTATLDAPVFEVPPVATQTQTQPAPDFSSTDTTSAPPLTNTLPPPPQAQGEPADVPRMSIEDLRAKLNRGEVTVVDVRDNASYQRDHIPGALNIPMASTQSMIDLIPKGKPVVTYCT